MEGFKPAVIAPRKAGETRVAVLQAAHENRPALAIKFATPDFLVLASAEATASAALAAVRESSQALQDYGFGDRRFDDAEMPGLARLVVAVETAARLWLEWNVAVVDPATGEVTALPLERKHIVRVLEDAQIRAVWNAHLEAASALEREEGNVSAASPLGSTASAATTAPDVSENAPPAPVDNAGEPESSAPA